MFLILVSLRKVKLMIREFLNSTLKSRGLHITPINEYEEQVEKVKDVWLQKMQISTILDIGASDGGFARKARKMFPNAHIYSFEPLPASFAKLNAHFEGDKKFTSFHFVLSNQEGEITFYQSSRSGSSSLLEMGDLHKESYPESAQLTELKVKSYTLDAVIGSGQINYASEVLMKLDVQGAESLVLEGAREALKRTKIVFTEMSFTELYKGQVTANAMISLLDSHGFQLCGIENVSRNVQDGSFLQCDAYFLRKE